MTPPKILKSVNNKRT